MNWRRIPVGLIWAVLIALPLFVTRIGEPFYVTLATRLLIFALAASSLNLVLGYGGMVSFGHAAFFGAGGYIVGILGMMDIFSGWISWPLALIVAGLLALIIGAISLRTRGVYFIMITLAFAQMLFFLFVSLRVYGGQDGLSLDRSLLGLGLDLENNVTFYYVVLALLTLTLVLLHRIIHSRFGIVVGAIKENETRMMALGYSVFRYKLLAFAIGGALAGLAGALNANLNTFISPNALAWPLSGQMIMMVIVGGVGRFWGGMVGAIVFLLLETILSRYTIYWQLGVGVVLLVIVLNAPQGIVGLVTQGVNRVRKTKSEPTS
jgi:branched-chain amino acid transport system permease protein